MVISAPAVCMTMPFGIVLRPSIWFSSAGKLGETTSITFFRSAVRAGRFEATRTACAAQTAFR